jgi:hypothetical protein
MGVKPQNELKFQQYKDEKFTRVHGRKDQVSFKETCERKISLKHAKNS